MGESCQWQGSGRGGNFCLRQTGYQTQGRRLLAAEIQGSWFGSTVGKATVANLAGPLLQGFELFEEEPFHQPYPQHHPSPTVTHAPAESCGGGGTGFSYTD